MLHCNYEGQSKEQSQQMEINLKKINVSCDFDLFIYTGCRCAPHDQTLVAATSQDLITRLHTYQPV